MKQGQTVKDQIITMLLNGYFEDVIADRLFTSKDYVKQVRRGLERKEKYERLSKKKAN